MKKIFTVLMVLSISLLSFGQGRLIKSSAKSQPKWIDREVDQYELIKVGSSSTISLEDAKENAFNQLKAKVIVATTRYLMSISVNSDEETVRNSVIRSQFVKNISESTSLDTYWEVRYIKRHNQTVYHYYALYHFNEFEMKKLALEVNKKGSSTLDAVNEL